MTQVLNVFEPFRMAPTPLDQYETVGRKILQDKIETFTRLNKPIEFIMLGYPFKSSNERDKVIGKLPDLAEEISLKNFSLFNEKVKEVYKPGVTINIASDGYAFNDMLGIEDRTVQDYLCTTKEMARDASAPMNFYKLSDFYSSDLATSREKLLVDFGITDEELERKILMDADVNFLYRGMIRFMNEELAVKEYPTKSQLQKAAKKLVRNMMLRNEAYSNLVKKEFSDHIRLSMHPSINNGAKYSFQLIPGKHAFRSPWHTAVHVKDGEYITVHKKEAEEQGLKLVYKNERPYFYED